MLGDVPIFGSFSCTVDEKGRIFLPSMTKATKGDSIILSRSNVGSEVFDAFPLQIFNARIESLDKIIYTSFDDERIKRAMDLKKELCSLALINASVDSQRRVLVSPSIFSVLGYNPAKLYCLGEGSSFKIFTNEEGYEKYTGYAFCKSRGNSHE
ncbi:MAG: hypothetical protein PUC82_01495 [bacterium]|nr:hypothetical protein [bacterium]